MSSRRLAAIGALVADPSRAAILLALLGGTAHTNAELARHVGIAPSTASEHLGKLLDGGLVAVESQGRHRYWRLASTDVAALLETLLAEAPDPVHAPPRPDAPSALVLARSCYDHLAGHVAVELFDSLVAGGHLTLAADRLDVTVSGRRLLSDLGVDDSAFTTSRRAAARACLDWTRRRHHLGGAVGAGLLTAMFDRGWVRRGPHPRQIQVSATGRNGLRDQLGVTW